MVRKFLILVGVIVVVTAALMLSLYVLDFMKFPELRADLTKIFSVIGICTARLLITFLVQAAEKK